MKVEYLRDVRVTSPDIIIVENIGNINYNQFHQYGVDFIGNTDNLVGIWKKKKSYKYNTTM